MGHLLRHVKDGFSGAVLEHVASCFAAWVVDGTRCRLLRCFSRWRNRGIEDSCPSHVIDGLRHVKDDSAQV